MTEVTATLDNWVYDTIWNVFWGNVRNDVKGRFIDGDWIHTSDIPSLRDTRWSDLKEGDLVHTLNSTYKLGKRKVI